MGVTVNPDFVGFQTRYPQFSDGSGSIPAGSQPVTAALYQLYFNEATLYQANDGSGPLSNATQALQLMQMLVAHIAFLNTAPATGGDASPLVGRIGNATEGSVTVGTTNEYPPGSAQWFQQTKFGAAWWQATAQYRTMRYRVGPPTVPAGYGYGRFGGCRGCGRGW